MMGCWVSCCFSSEFYDGFGFYSGILGSMLVLLVL